MQKFILVHLKWQTKRTNLKDIDHTHWITMALYVKDATHILKSDHGLTNGKMKSVILTMLPLRQHCQ